MREFKDVECLGGPMGGKRIVYDTSRHLRLPHADMMGCFQPESMLPLPEPDFIPVSIYIWNQDRTALVYLGKANSREEELGLLRKDTRDSGTTGTTQAPR